MATNEPWIALAATEDLPIVTEPVEGLAGAIVVKTVPLPYKPLDPAEETQWAAALAGAGGILLRSGFVTDSLLDKLPALQVVAVHGAGVDPVDVAACTERGVWVTNTPGANAAAVAELCIGLMVNALRAVPSSAHAATVLRQWDEARVTGRELGGRTLGLIGIGQIGQRVARIADAFGMRVIAHDPGLQPDEIEAKGAQPATLPELLSNSDIVSLHAPAIPATHHLINQQTLALMRRDALLINCARGSLVDEVALAAALEAGELGGAALDVLDGEPPDPDSPIYNAPNVILTPHMAGSTFECLQTIAGTAGADLVRVLGGQPPLHPVNEPNLKK